MMQFWLDLYQKKKRHTFVLSGLPYLRCLTSRAHFLKTSKSPLATGYLFCMYTMNTHKVAFYISRLGIFLAKHSSILAISLHHQASLSSDRERTGPVGTCSWHPDQASSRCCSSSRRSLGRLVTHLVLFCGRQTALSNGSP